MRILEQYRDTFGPANHRFSRKFAGQPPATAAPAAGLDPAKSLLPQRSSGCSEALRQTEATLGKPRPTDELNALYLNRVEAKLSQTEPRRRQLKRSRR